MQLGERSGLMTAMTDSVELSLKSGITRETLQDLSAWRHITASHRGAALLAQALPRPAAASQGRTQI